MERTKGTSFDIMYLLDGVILTVLLVVGLRKIKVLIVLHPEIKESVSMMKTHLCLFIGCEITIFIVIFAKIFGS